MRVVAGQMNSDPQITQITQIQKTNEGERSSTPRLNKNLRNLCNLWMYFWDLET